MSGNIGTVDAHGVFTATAPGTGTITATAGSRSATVQVTVSSAALQTLEDFEDEQTIFSNVRGGTLSITNNSNDVRIGRGAGRLDYTLDAYNSTGTGYITELWIGGELETGPYNQLNLWVYGDGSGLPLSLLYFDGTRMNQELLITNLDFTGWKQVTVGLTGVERIDGLQLSREMDISASSSGGSGTIYLDQMVLSFTGTVDNTPPTVTLSASGATLTATVSDAVDGVLPGVQRLRHLGRQGPVLHLQRLHRRPQHLPGVRRAAPSGHRHRPGRLRQHRPGLLRRACGRGLDACLYGHPELLGGHLCGLPV